MVPPLEVLKASRIEIENDPRKIKPLPPYAEGLRDLLLSFEGIVPLGKVCFIFSEFWFSANDFSFTFEQRLKLEDLYENDKESIDTEYPLPQAIPKTLYRDAKYGKHKEIWELAGKLRDTVKGVGKPRKEAPWNGVISNFVFDSINEQTSE